MKIHLRGMISLDLPEVGAVVRLACPDAPLSEAELRAWTRFDPPRPRLAVVAECRDENDAWEFLPVGVALYTVRRGRLTLDRLAVHPLARRRNVGRRLLAEVQRRTLTHCVPRVVATVPETDLDALRFARACGVRPARLVPGEPGEPDGVRFVVPGGLRPAVRGG